MFIRPTSLENKDNFYAVNVYWVGAPFYLT